MDQSKTKYRPLPQGENEKVSVYSKPVERRSIPLRSISVVVALCCSLCLNTFFYLDRIPLWTRSNVHATSRFAQLSPDIPTPWLSSSPYYGEDESIADEMWDGIDISNGSVALNDDYVTQMGLPHSQRFPWDESKGLYILNGYHSLHCLKTIRSWVKQQASSPEPGVGAGHILHCLDALRQDVLCYADDTPRYTGFQPKGRSGSEQLRQCRDWSKMERWAQDHSACWRYLHGEHPNMNILEEYKFCPENSPYWDAIHRALGDA